MELEISLLCSYQSTIGPYPESYAFIESTSSRPISLRKVLTLSSHICLGLASCLLPSGSSTKILYALISRTCYMPRPSHPLSLDHLDNK